MVTQPAAISTVDYARGARFRRIKNEISSCCLVIICILLHFRQIQFLIKFLLVIDLVAFVVLRVLCFNFVLKMVFLLHKLELFGRMQLNWFQNTLIIHSRF